MYKENLSFNSDLNYRPIINSGSTSFSISSPTEISLGQVSSANVTVFLEIGGERRLPKVREETVYVEGGYLKISILATESISGNIYWREYGN